MTDQTSQSGTWDFLKHLNWPQTFVEEIQSIDPVSDYKKACSTLQSFVKTLLKNSSYRGGETESTSENGFQCSSACYKARSKLLQYFENPNEIELVFADGHRREVFLMTKDGFHRNRKDEMMLPPIDIEKQRFFSKISRRISPELN